MFQSTPEKKASDLKKFSYHTELIPIQNSARLLSKPALQSVIKKLKILINQPEDHYQYLYYSTLERVAECVQSLPSYKNKTYNNLGGMLDLAITRAYLVLSQYRQKYPVNKYSPDKMPLKLSLWSYALFTASIFYNIGYLATNFFVSICDKRGRNSSHWNPMQSAMILTNSSHFRFSFLNTNYDALASRYTILFAKHLMPVEGLAWIASDIEIMDYWLAILQDDERGGGLFATQVMTAEEKLLLQDSNFLQLLGIPTREQMLQLQDHERLEKYLHQHHEKNQGAEQNSSEPDVPVDPSKGHSHMAVAINERDVTGGQVHEIGERFIAWLKNGVKGNSISVNRPESMLHIVSEGALLLTPQVFQEFLKQNPQLAANWQQVASGLKQLGIIITQINQIQQYSSSQQGGSARFGIGSQKSATQSGLVIDPTVLFNQQKLPDTNSEFQKIPLNIPPQIPTTQATASPAAPPPKSR